MCAIPSAVVSAGARQSGTWSACLLIPITPSICANRVAVAKHAQQQAEAAGLGAPAAELADGPAAGPSEPAGGAEAYAHPPAQPQEVRYLQLPETLYIGNATLQLLCCMYTGCVKSVGHMSQATNALLFAPDAARSVPPGRQACWHWLPENFRCRPVHVFCMYGAADL